MTNDRYDYFYNKTDPLKRKQGCTYFLMTKTTLKHLLKLHIFFKFLDDKSLINLKTDVLLNRRALFFKNKLMQRLFFSINLQHRKCKLINNKCICFKVCLLVGYKSKLFMADIGVKLQLLMTCEYVVNNTCTLRHTY